MNDISTIFSNISSILSIGVTLVIAFLCLINVQGVNKSGNRWFGTFMLCISFLYVYDIFTFAGMKIENAIVSIVLFLPAFIIAPVFYYTVSYFITPDRPWKIKDYFNLSWLMLLYILLSPYLSYEETSQATQIPHPVVASISFCFLILFFLNLVCYCTLSWVKLKKHKKNIHLFASTIQNLDLKWLKYIIICVLVIACCFIIMNFIVFFNYYNIIIQILPLIGFFSIAYFSMKQKEIYPFTTDQRNEVIYAVIKGIPEKQTPKKLIEDHKLQELKTNLLDIMQDVKPFLDGELNLVKLASMMNISSHQLSYLINVGFNENFYQFINKYRIEEAKRLILDQNMVHLSIQEIAFEVGFNSKSSFNVIFKKSTGHTPTNYRSVSYTK